MPTRGGDAAETAGEDGAGMNYMAVDHVLDGGDDVVGALDDGLFHLAGVRHGASLHAETHGRGASSSSKRFSLTMGGEGGADAAGARGFVENAELVGALEESIFQSTGFKQVSSMKSASMPRVELAMASSVSLDAVEVGDDGDSLAVLDGFIARQLVDGGLVKRKEGIGRHRSARFHHLDREQQDAGAVVMNHRLGQTVASCGLEAEQIFKPGMPMM